MKFIKNNDKKMVVKSNTSLLLKRYTSEKRETREE